MSRKRIAILTSGGDAPGMNAAVRAATLGAIDQGYTVLGVKYGYRGLMDGEFERLEPADVAAIQREGGTILGSARSLEFHERAGRDTARRRLRDARVEGLLVIGGNGSLTGALRLGDAEELGDQRLGVVGLPASIDNDIGITSLAIGVDTAINTIVEACDKIADTATAHERTFIIEVMGRDCGYLAMASSVAAGADVVLFRESGRSDDERVGEVVEAIEAALNRREGDRHVLVIMSEGLEIAAHQLKERVDTHFGAAGRPVETRVTVLGHVVRGGRPSGFDRLMASRLGYVGARALISGETRCMVAWDPARRVLPADARPSPFDPRCHLVDLGAVLDETARLLDGTSPIAQWRVRIFDEIEQVLRL